MELLQTQLRTNNIFNTGKYYGFKKAFEQVKKIEEEEQYNDFIPSVELYSSLFPIQIIESKFTKNEIKLYRKGKKVGYALATKYLYDWGIKAGEIGSEKWMIVNIELEIRKGKNSKSWKSFCRGWYQGYVDKTYKKTCETLKSYFGEPNIQEDK